MIRRSERDASRGDFFIEQLQNCIQKFRIALVDHVVKAMKPKLILCQALVA
jgi:hypothetical protein